MSAQTVNHPEVVAEVRAAFEHYEAALLRNDIDALDAFFWSSPHTVRYGIAEHAWGIDAIRACRRQLRPVHPGRRLRGTVITTFGRDTASICTEFVAPDTSRIGRQTQMWVRFEAGWRIVAAHVSSVDPAQLTVY